MSAFIVFLQAFTSTGVAFVYIAGIITGCLGNHFCNKTTVRLLSLFKGMKRSLQFFTPSLVNHPEVLRKPYYEPMPDYDLKVSEFIPIYRSGVSGAPHRL